MKNGLVIWNENKISMNGSVRQHEHNSCSRLELYSPLFVRTCPVRPMGRQRAREKCDSIGENADCNVFPICHRLFFGIACEIAKTDIERFIF